MKSEWMTSRAVSVSTTGSFAGTWSWFRFVKSSAVPSCPSRPGYVTFHSNCFASTSSRWASCGKVRGSLTCAQTPALTTPSAMTIRVGIAVQMISALMLPWMYRALRPSRPRYFTR